jgi:hypothetical protein
MRGTLGKIKSEHSTVGKVFAVGPPIQRLIYRFQALMWKIIDLVPSGISYESRCSHNCEGDIKLSVSWCQTAVKACAKTPNCGSG